MTLTVEEVVREIENVRFAVEVKGKDPIATPAQIAVLDEVQDRIERLGAWKHQVEGGEWEK